MRRINSLGLGMVMLFSSMLVSARPVTAQQDPAVAEASQKTEAFVTAMIDFTKNVRLDEAGLRAVLDNMESLNSIKDEDESDALTEKAFHDGRYDVSVILDDPEYVSWARGRGLDPKGFFKDMMRLVSLNMREQVQRSREQMKASMPETRKQIEAMRSQMGEEAYHQAQESIKAGTAMLDHMAELVDRLPAPTDSEARLLDRYRDQIEQAMEAGGDDPMDSQGMGPEEYE